MSVIKSIVSVLCVVIFFLGSNSVYAQGSGSISGTVTDKTTGEALPGVNVFLEGTSIGSATNVEGQYIIHQISAGEYKLIARYIGYKDQSITVTVEANKKSEIKIELEYAATEIEEIAITAQASGQLSAINQQLSSKTIKNVVSADRIQDVPDANAAESVARLPGISLVRSGGEGQKVAIRGLSPKYNVMMVNGVRMQSTDRDDRSVDMNMIAPNILSGIEVTKALTADMDADAVGGTVNLKIGKAAQGLKGNLALQGGYGSMADTYGNFKATGLVSNRFFKNKLGIQMSGSMDKYNRNSDALNAGYALNEEDIKEDGFIPIDLASLSISDKVTDRQRLSGGLVFDFQFAKGSLIMNNFISNLSEKQTEQVNSLGLIGNGFSGSFRDGGMSNTVISNALQGEFDFSLFSMDFSFSNSMSKQHTPGDKWMGLGIAFGEAGYTTPTLEDPKNATPREFLSAVQIVEGKEKKRLNDWSTLERNVKDIAREAALNFNVPFNISEAVSGNIKLGGKYVRSTRDNDETEYYSTYVGYNELFIRQLKDSLWTDLGVENIDFNQGLRAFLMENPNYNIGDFLNGEAGINDFYYKIDVDKMRHFEELARTSKYYPVNPRTSFQYDYDYTRDLAAFFAMAELNIGKYVTLFPGIRYENYKINYDAYYTEKYGPYNIDFKNEQLNSNTKGSNWFPQMQIRVKPTDWIDVRLASTKSIIYPDYRAISPYISYNSYGDPAMDLGNTSLQPALSQNYDIYASVYKNSFGLFTAGYFYKDISNLIVASSFRTKDSEKINNRFQLTQTQQTTVNTWINLEAVSNVKGFELDWQTHFWYLPSFLKGIVLNLNYTHITSETSYPFQTSKKLGTGPFAKLVFIDSTRTGNMPNQPDDILNATLGYDVGGFSARLSFVYQDNVLVGINRTYKELDSFTDAYYRWDFTAYQKLPWIKGLQMYLNINNLSNTPDRSYISELRKLSSVNYYGRTVDLGIRYEF